MVRINGARSRKAEIVSPDDRVEVADQVRSSSIEPNHDLKVDILYADEALIVANKPGGMPCHPLRADERDTVMNAIVAKYPETAEAGDAPREGGLIHRLDNGTSGALLIARTPESFRTMRAAIRRGDVRRTYEALVDGQLTSRLELNAPIAHHPRNPRKMVLGDSGSSHRASAGRAAATIVEPLQRAGSSTLVRVTPRTGSRHQIRVHLSGAGFPIVGDTLYGGSKSTHMREGRFWLHLAKVEFESIKAAAPLPADLVEELRARTDRV